MHLPARFLLFIICVQQLSILTVLANDTVLSQSGAYIDPDLSEPEVFTITGSVFSGSVLHEEENIVLENSSISESSVSSQSSSVDDISSDLLVRISEVAWMGSDASSSDEWVELSVIAALTGSVRTDTLNLHGWRLTVRKDAGETTIAFIDRDLTATSGSILLVANNTASASRLLEEPAFVSTSVSLPNTKLQIRLYDAAGMLVDEVDDFIGAPFAGTNPSAASGLFKATMERLHLRSTGADKANWQTATESRGFDEGSMMLGTPGFAVAPPLPPPPPERPSIIPQISELLPDPAGNDEEWIELVQTGSTSIDLVGWLLQSGTRSFTFTAGTVLYPSTPLVVRTSETGLQLPNAGGEVRLGYQGNIYDTLAYGGVPDGVSVGRSDNGTIRSFCVPTPGAFNTLLSPMIALSGYLKDLPNPTSLNLAVVALSGSIAGGSCTVDYGDGFVSNSCNPPSHSMKRMGHVPIHTTVRDYCGNTIIHQDVVHVVSTKSVKKQTSSQPMSVCRPTATGGLTISEFLAAPSGGGDEWIELQNISNTDIQLCGWSVDDAVGGSAAYRLDHLNVEAGSYLLVRSSESRLSLNNDADTVRLIAPDGKDGTGVVLTVPFQDAASDQSTALRTDGIYLQTPFPTPGTENRFVPLNTTPGSSPVILSAALPNPIGVDMWDEWVEFTNLTGRPQWLNGWRIEDAKGQQWLLDKRVLAKRESLRIPLYKTGFTLANSNTHIRLIDDQGVIRSVLAWDKTSEGKMVRRSIDCTEEEQSMKPASLTLSGALAMHLLPSYLHYKFEYENYVSALLKNKKVVQKKCSDGAQSFHVDGVDIALLLLDRGLAFVDPLDLSPRHAEFVVYEQLARAQRRGAWVDPSALIVADAWKNDRMLDHIVASGGLVVSVSVESGLLATGSVIAVETNVPADLWVKQGTGAYRRFDGGMFISHDLTITFLATYEFKTIENLTSAQTVVTQSYALKKDHYPHCIRISEVYPSPKRGEKEWVEFENICDDDVRLLGWSMDDETGASSKPFVIDDITVTGGSMSILSGSLLPISLNNSRDSVVLLDPNGRVQAVMNYGKTTSGRSWALKDDIYCQTTRPTPLHPNVCQVPVSKAQKASNPSIKMTIGTATKYLADSLFSDEVNKKSDQINTFIEGLNANIKFINTDTDLLSIFAIILFLSGLVSLGVGVWLYGKKYRLWQ